jgi:hypothetical protein
MANKLPEDVAYTITTGYYPEIASKIKYKNKKGKGGIGKKFVRKRGFTDVSIEKERARKSRDTTIQGLAGGPMAGMNLLKRMVGTRNDPEQVYYKFTGGSENYKLFGDQVWYMHGVRAKDDINNYLESTFGDKHPRFGQIYNKMEPRLVAEATALAEEIFDISVDEVEKELRAADGTDAAEEIGFSDGEFTYMSHAEAMKMYPDQADKIKKQSMSRANPRDMVVIKDGQIVGTRDVTEMPLTKVGQHGITNVPPELKEAIKEVRGDGRRTAKLRQAVIKMFTNAISQDYNPMIQDIKDYAGFAGKKGQNLGGDWSKVLKGMTAKGKVGQGSNTVTTNMLGQALGVTMAQGGLQHAHNKSTEQVSIEYIAHMLGTLNLNTNETFKQSHLVFEHPNGQGVYANVPMVTNPDTLLFEEPPVAGTSITSGFNATMAMSTKAGLLNRATTAEMSQSQKHAYSMSKITGVTSSKSGQAVATANMGIHRGTRPATVVTIPAVDKLEEALISDLENKLPNIKHRLGQKGSKLQQRMYGLGKNRRKMTTGTNPNKAQFWALPYIGVVGSEYIQK